MGLRVDGPSSRLVCAILRLKGGSSDLCVARLSSRPLSDGWLAGLTSSQRVPLRGKADSKRTGLVVVKLVGFAHL